MEILGVFNDVMLSSTASDVVAEMIREKIRSIVVDPKTAETLCPKDHPFGSKRAVPGHKLLPDLQPSPRSARRPSPRSHRDDHGLGNRHASETFEFDAIVYATGFDAMTGPIVAVDITGRDGLSLREKWADGPSTYLGLTTVGFPNFFTITGPGSPSVLSNMTVSIEQHVDWVADCLEHLHARDLESIEPTPLAEAG